MAYASPWRQRTTRSEMWPSTSIGTTFTSFATTSDRPQDNPSTHTRRRVYFFWPNTHGMRMTGYPYALAAQASPVRFARPRRVKRVRRRSMQSSHLVFRTEKAKCSLCIEMRVEPHSKVVSRRECDIRSADKTSTSWEELASAKGTSTTASTAELRPPVSSMRRGLHSLLSEALRQKRDADAYVRSAEPLSDEMLRRKTAHSKTPKRPT